MCISVLPVYVCTRVSGPLELELQTVVSCHVGTWNWTWILKEKPVLLTAEPSLQPLESMFFSQLYQLLAVGCVILTFLCIIFQTVK